MKVNVLKIFLIKRIPRILYLFAKKLLGPVIQF